MIREFFKALFQDPPKPVCEVCGLEMEPGYRTRTVIVFPMCRVPHPIMSIPRIHVPTETE